MFLLKQILPAVLLAMAVGAGVQGLAWWWGTPRAQRTLMPVALGLGYFFGQLFITGWTPFPPTDTTNWLPYLGLAAAGLGAFWRGFPKAALGWVTLALLAVGALRLLLEPKFRYGWGAGQGWMCVVGLGLGIVLLGVILFAHVRRSSSAIEILLVLLVVSTGVSGALMLSGSFLLGQFGAVLAGAILGAMIFSLRGSALEPARPRAGESRALVSSRPEGRPSPMHAMEEIAPVVAVFLGVLLVSGFFFADLPVTSAVLLAGAPVLALIPTGGLSGLRSAALRIILVSLPVAAAVILAFRASPPLYY